MHPTSTPPTILPTIQDATPTATVAVSALCEFTAKHGDLDFRFTPSPSAQEGIAGHQAVTARRIAANPQYQREVALNADHFGLRVRGRADGFDPQAQRLDEIKTHRGNLARMPANHRHLHWAQAKVYAHMQCQQLSLVSIKVALVYFEVITGDETVLCEEHTALDLQAFFSALCAQYASWAAQEAAHRLARDLMLTALAFPHEAFRAGQRPLSEAVYKANLAGRCLLAQAPTGIGKTMGVLYPALKAAPAQKIDKVLFLTAKTPGRALAVRAFEKLHFSAASSAASSSAHVPLRLLELVAKDKACEHPGSACHGDSCPLAKGFYDRLPAARLAAVNVSQALDKTALRELAQQHAVCPYYLAQALVRWADVIVGDYNHYFDLTAQLYGATLNEDWRVSVLVDEAHNLVSRGRQMYSAELDYSALRAAQQGAPSTLKKPLAQLQRQWQALLRDQSEPYLVHATLPDKLLAALQKLAAEIGAYSAENPDGLAGELKRFYFDVLLFVRLAELHGAHSLFDVTLADSGQPNANSTLCLRNVIPAPLLAERFKKAHSVTLFSATLSPQNYVHDLLGLPPNTAWLDVPSAFAPQQLSIQVARHISTRFNDRSASLASVVRVMAQQYAIAPGNYLAFFSSFDYLQMAAQQLSAAHPAIAQWQQSRRMNEPEREAFLARFTPHGRGIGFAVLGGAFGEGIDLPGPRLIGAFIATLGLPQVNPVNEQIKARMQQFFDKAESDSETGASTTSKAYDYTYLYPGLQKVVQAAGRVIRTPEDQGVVFLMDDRYARGEVQRLFPAWWNVL